MVKRLGLAQLPPAARGLVSSLCAELGAIAVEDGHAADAVCLWLSTDDADAVVAAAAAMRQRLVPMLVLVEGDAAARALSRIELPVQCMLLAWPASRDMLALQLRQLLQVVQDAFDPVRARALLGLVANTFGFSDFEYDLSTNNRSRSLCLSMLPNPPTHCEIELELIHPDDRSHVLDAYARCRNTGAAMRVDVRVAADGEDYRWLRIEGEVIGRNRNHLGHLIGVCRDIDQDVNDRQSFHGAQRQLAHALANAGMASWEWLAADGVRKVVADGLGWWRSNGSEVLDAVLHPSEVARDRARFDEAVRSGGAYRSEVRVLHPRLGLRWLEISGSPHADIDGRVLGMSGVAQDVTERRVRDKELADAQRLLNASLEAGSMYCWEWNLVDGRRRTLGPSERIVGVNLEVIDESRSLVHPQDRAAARAMVQRAIKHGLAYQSDFRIVRPDGAIRWIHSRGDAVRDERGEVVRVSGVAIDITERREAEDSLEDSNRRLALAMHAARLNPWSVDLVNEVHISGPLDVAFYGKVLASREQFLQCVHPDDRGIVEGMRDAAFLHSQQPGEFTYRVIHDDGSQRWIRNNVQGVCDAQGALVQMVGVSKDVTDIHVTNERLLRTQAQIDRAQHATNMALWEWSRREGIRYYRAGGHLLGRDEMPVVHPDDFVRVARKLLRSLRLGNAYQDEFRVVQADGRIDWVAAHAGVSSDGGNGEPALIGLLLEITQQRETATELAATQARLHRALDAGGMFGWDWNLPTPHAIGAAVPEFGRYVAFGVIHADDEYLHRDALAQALNGEDGRYRCELRVQDEHGGYTWLLVSGQRVLDSGGKAVRLSGVAMDITVRKAVETLLLESHEWQRLAVGAAELNLWRIDMSEGRRHGGDLDWRMYGFSPASIEELLPLVHEDDRQHLFDALQYASESGLPYETEYRLQMPLYGERWVRDRGEVTESGPDGARQLVGVSLDITQQRQAHEELSRALTLAYEASEAKSGFLAAMSHELRTPLNAVIGFAGLLGNNPDPGALDAHLHALQNAAHQLMLVIDNVLDFSRIEAGALPLESAPFSLAECFAGALDMVAATAEEKGLTLMLVAHDAQGDQVLGDATRVRQIVLNLLSNAIKFTDEGAVRAALGLFRDGERVDIVLGVADSGIGMTAETMGRLFEPFRQGDESTVRRFGGSGLGLSISRRLVEMMGGTIEVDSRLGEGSRFLVRFSLPLVESQLPVVRRPLSGLRIGSCVRSTHLRDALRDQLREYGAEVVDIDARTLGAAALRDAGPMSALVFGNALLPLLQGIEAWPLAQDGASPLPLLPLVGIDVPTRPRIGPHGEQVVPIARALKPRQLLQAIESLSGTQRHEVVPALAATTESEFADLNVLIVEDNEINRTLLMLQLESLGIVATLAENGEQAIALQAAHPCEIVLMDVEMPGMDGMQATAVMLDAVPHDQPRPYVVAVTAHVFGDTRERMVRAGMEDFVSKPVLMEELHAALVRGQRALQARRG